MCTKESKMNYKFDGSKVYFTSDTHFYHSNIIGFCKRPFKNVEDMNETLIENWNRVVGQDDIVFHLGDFCLGGSHEWTKILNRLNGKIYLILGNHDLKNIRQGYASRIDKHANAHRGRQAENLPEPLSVPLLWRCLQEYVATVRACAYEQE